MTSTHHDQGRAANLAENPHAGQGPVLLDVGGDVGALVVLMSQADEGLEVEIEPAGGTPDHTTAYSGERGHQHPHRPHVAVTGRPCGASVAYCAVFPGLVTGAYELSIHGRPGAMRVDVPGGRVTEVGWAS